MAGVNVEYLPVPQRYQGNGLTISAPSFVLPKDIKTIEDARRFIAAKYEIKIENVGRMGESYFSYIGMMPKRVFPFAVKQSLWSKPASPRRFNTAGKPPA